MAQAEAALTEAWEAEVARVQAAAEARSEELQAEMLRLRTQLDDSKRAQQDTVGGAGGRCLGRGPVSACATKRC